MIQGGCFYGRKYPLLFGKLVFSSMWHVQPWSNLRLHYSRPPRVWIVLICINPNTRLCTSTLWMCFWYSWSNIILVIGDIYSFKPMIKYKVSSWACIYTKLVCHFNVKNTNAEIFILWDKKMLQSTAVLRVNFYIMENTLWLWHMSYLRLLHLN